MLKWIKRKIRNFVNTLDNPRIELWLDDVREPPGHEWVWATTYEECIYYLSNYVVVTASLDHDLGENKKTGYDVACWLEMNYLCLPKITKIHSMNPVGREKMRIAIKKAQWLLDLDLKNKPYYDLINSL